MKGKILVVALYFVILMNLNIVMQLCDDHRKIWILECKQVTLCCKLKVSSAINIMMVACAFDAMQSITTSEACLLR